MWSDTIWQRTTEGLRVGVPICTRAGPVRGALRTRSVGLLLEARTLEQMLLLARSVLRSYLLAVDALDRQALVVFCGDVWSAYWNSIVQSVQ